MDLNEEPIPNLIKNFSVSGISTYKLCGFALEMTSPACRFGRFGYPIRMHVI
jgi:hypothetical protein